MPRCILAMRKGKPVLPRIGAARLTDSEEERRETAHPRRGGSVEARNESRAKMYVCVDGKGLKTDV